MGISPQSNRTEPGSTPRYSGAEPGSTPDYSGPNGTGWSHARRRVGEVTVLAAAVAAFPSPIVANSELGPLGIALVVAFLILSLGIHEAAHAWVAWRCGDSTARDLGRMTINPIPHIDPWMTIIIPGLLAFAGAPIFGGAKPVPVNYHNLRHPLRDMALVAIAGPASNFLIAILFAIAWKLCLGSGMYEADSLMVLVLLYSMFANVMLTAFNLLPIPPLDGSRLLPRSFDGLVDAMAPYSMIVLLLVANAVPIGPYLIEPLQDFLLRVFS